MPAHTLERFRLSRRLRGADRRHRARCRHCRHLDCACISSSAGLRSRSSTAAGRARAPPTAMPASSRATRSFRRRFRRIGARLRGSRSSAHREANYHLAFLPRAAPWLLAFRAASQPARLIETAQAMRPLFARAVAEHEALMQPSPAPSAISTGAAGSSSIAATRGSRRRRANSILRRTLASPTCRSIATRRACARAVACAGVSPCRALDRRGRASPIRWR